MFNSKISILLFISTCSNALDLALDDSHTKMQVTTRSQIIDRGIFFANKYSFHKGNLVYVLCNSDSRPTVNCKIVQESYPYKGVARSCSVTLENHHNNGFLTIVVAALGRNTAVLIWKYKDSHHSTIVTVGTINLETCRMNKVKIPNSELSVLLELYLITKFVSYDDDYFDIFYNDPRSQGADAPLYKMQINGNGHIRNEPEIVNVERGRYLFVSSIATGSPSKGYIYVRKNRMELSSTLTYFLWLVKPDGTRKHVAEYNAFPRSDVSAGNNFISLCYKTKPRLATTPKTSPMLELIEFEPDLESFITATPVPKLISDIEYRQYDENGNTLFTTKLTDTNYDIDTLTIHNLPGGGMLIMYSAKKNNEDERQSRESTFEIVKIDSGGYRIGTLPTQQIDIPPGMVRHSYIYKNGNKGYCGTVVVRNTTLSDLSLKYEAPMYLTIHANCFNEFEFLIW